MENRKIIRLGRSSHVISLPKSWLKLSRLKRGDMVSLDVQKNGTLVVYPKVSKEELKEITIKIDPKEKDGHTIRKIMSAYLNGFSKVRLVSSNIFTITQQKTIRNTIGKLTMRIMSATPHEVLIQDFLDTSKISVDMGIRRMHLITFSMFKDALKAFKERDATLASSIWSLDEDVNHFSYLLLRLLRSVVFGSIIAVDVKLELGDCLDYQSIVQRIEHIADHAVDIAGHAIIFSRSKIALSPNLLELLLSAGDKAGQIFNDAINSFFSEDVEKANQLIDSLDEVKEISLKIVEEMIKIKDAFTCCGVCSIRDSINRVAEHGSDIAKITINRYFVS